MRLSKINILNYKGFEQCEVEFNPKVNVFIGSNASGKTTMLTAILKSVYSVTRKFSQLSRHKELNLSPDDVNYNAKFCLIDATLKDFPNYESLVNAVVYTKPLTKEDLNSIKVKQKSAEELIKTYENELSTSPFTIPIFKFYPANRGGLTYAEQRSQKSYLVSQLEAWSNLYQDAISYSRFFNWFFEQETDELRLQRDVKDFTIQNPALRDVRSALSLAFELLGYGRNIKIKSTQVKREGNSTLTPNLILENTETKQEESLDNKSDGEKAIITLISDIAYNLSLAKDFMKDNTFLNSPGIVIIDEIETHLHPNWQRQIVPILTTVFPNIQLFIATHSPQIVGSVKSDSVFICDNFHVNKVTLKTKGEDTNSLLKYIFNATDRPKEYMDLLQKFYEGIENNATYEQLEQIIGEVKRIESEDNSDSISDLLNEMRLQLEAYKFDREYAENK